MNFYGYMDEKGWINGWMYKNSSDIMDELMKRIVIWWIDGWMY